MLRGNTITPINPHTGALGTSVFVASEPTILAIADDGSRIYVASDTTNLVTPFSLTTMSPGASFAIGSGDRRVADMEVAPGNPAVLAVSTRMGSQPKRMAVFVNGSQLPMTTSDSAWNNSIEFGANATTLHGHASSLSELDFNKFTLDLGPTGGFVDTVYNAKYLLTSGGLDMEFANGRMYFTNGQVLEVATPGPVGSYTGVNGPVEPDVASGRTFFLSSGNLKSYSQSTYVPLGSFSVTGISGSAINLIALEPGALAFATSGGQVYIARGDLETKATGNFFADSRINGFDFLAWQRGFGIETAATVSEGDGNADGDVDRNDFVTWAQQFGAAASASPTFTAVPEPSCCAMALSVACCLARIARRARV